MFKPLDAKILKNSPQIRNLRKISYLEPVGNVQNPKSRLGHDQIAFYTLGVPLGYPSKSASLPRKEVGERYRQVREVEGINFLPMEPLISRLWPSYVQKTANFNNRGVINAR